MSHRLQIITGLRLSIGLLVLCHASMQAGSTVTYPYGGVTWIVRNETAPRPENIHVVQIDLTNPGIRFQVTPGNANQASDSAIRETTAASTLDFMTAQNGQIAINAHFFQPNSTDSNRWIVGLGVSKGNIYSPFEGASPASATPANSLTLTQKYAIMTHAPALNIDANNIARIVHCDERFADRKHVLEAVTLYNAVSGSAQIVTDGMKTIPDYTQNDATGLTDGSAYSNADSWYNRVRSRTAIGLSQDNQTLTLFTVDEAGGSSGMTVGEVADMMRNDYGVWNGLNLDGGGSVSLAMQDPVTKVSSLVNSQSNGPTARIVATSLVVFANPEIAVEHPANRDLTDGVARIDFGGVNLGSDSDMMVLTVKNIGAADLTGLAVTRNGTNSGEFAVASPGVTTLAPGSSTTINVRFTPGGTGLRTASIRLANNDADENPFDIDLTGTGVGSSIRQR
jgi:hypothetical protein